MITNVHDFRNVKESMLAYHLLVEAYPAIEQVLGATQHQAIPPNRHNLIGVEVNVFASHRVFVVGPRN